VQYAGRLSRGHSAHYGAQGTQTSSTVDQEVPLSQILHSGGLSCREAFDEQIEQFVASA
jgi:hypothetical protein